MGLVKLSIGCQSVRPIMYKQYVNYTGSFTVAYLFGSGKVNGSPLIVFIITTYKGYVQNVLIQTHNFELIVFCDTVILCHTLASALDFLAVLTLDTTWHGCTLRTLTPACTRQMLREARLLSYIRLRFIATAIFHSKA